MNIEQKKENIKIDTDFFKVCVTLTVAALVGLGGFSTIENPTSFTKVLFCVNVLIGAFFAALAYETKKQIKQIIKTL